MKKNELDFDWSCLPAAAEWIAMDESGHWYSYSLEPTIDFNEWTVPECDSYLRIPHWYAPQNFKGKWTESLFKRPKK